MSIGSSLVWSVLCKFEIVAEDVNKLNMLYSRLLWVGSHASEEPPISKWWLHADYSQEIVKGVRVAVVYLSESVQLLPLVPPDAYFK